MKKSTLALLVCLYASHAIASAEVAQSAPPDIQHYMDASSGEKSDITDARADMMRQAGRMVGYQGGKAQRAWELGRSLIARNNQLNALYDFRTLISNDGWLPPVIDEAQDVAHITSDQIRTASHVYRILSPERFVSNPPSWRTWLLAGLGASNGDNAAQGIFPKTSDERHIWQEALEKGWQEGRDGADHTLEANFNRLTRDYRGMVLYSTLLRQGYISRPSISDEAQTVSGDRQKMVTGDRVRRIREHAGFTPNKRAWKPVVNTESHHEPNQDF
ncbi:MULTISPECIES: type IV secretory system conjugative DNA transfer family protein [Rosenbergiella]|uniref:type IV secretory system conjugative DNA transfer family protein n=1 Tax=Rosenbergiella TaxID=1356488 RepID=UPI001F5033AD|nr:MULTISPECIES: type IV secretory system conjugative DNA transfer family protein [Rosenbergiella]